ncbi:MAG TPA: hypothetical protein VL020_06150 [Pseudomonadales bacterium]|nr:hypothetical protein [Pseudomonadales bacterium]
MIKVKEGGVYKNGYGETVTAKYKVNEKPIYCVYGSIRPYYVDEKGVTPNGMHDSKLHLIAEMYENTSDHEDNDYAKLRAILDRAYEQAASGKGKERHANDKPFNKQPIAEIGRMVGTGYNLGQAMKKAQEAQGMANRGERDKAAHELLGAINYLASAVMLIEEV